MKRDILVVGNWKMNLSQKEAVKLAVEIKNSLLSLKLVEIALAPPFLFILEIKKILEKTAIQMAAQDVFWEEKGAFTGEISPLMLADLVKYVIIGHSERRQYFGETDETVNKKVKAVLKAGLNSVVCVGETLEAWRNGDTSGVTEQVDKAINGVSREMAEKVIIAYEPIWAIGTSKPAANTYANKICLQIRQVFSSLYGRELALKTKILYGGSVDFSNAAGYVEMSEIDGLLAGGASIKAKEFIEIVRKVSKVKT